jgi:hypothetical protein
MVAPGWPGHCLGDFRIGFDPERDFCAAQGTDVAQAFPRRLQPAGIHTHPI